METSEVNGHFLSTYCPSIASAGVLKPINHNNKQHISQKFASDEKLKTSQWQVQSEWRLTKTNLLVVSDTSCGLLCQEFFGVKEHTSLLLEGSLSLNMPIRDIKL